MTFPPNAAPFSILQLSILPFEWLGHSIYIILHSLFPHRPMYNQLENYAHKIYLKSGCFTPPHFLAAIPSK